MWSLSGEQNTYSSSSSNSSSVDCYVWSLHSHGCYMHQAAVSPAQQRSTTTKPVYYSSGNDMRCGSSCNHNSCAGVPSALLCSCFSSPHTRARQTTEIVWQVCSWPLVMTCRRATASAVPCRAVPQQVPQPKSRMVLVPRLKLCSTCFMLLCSSYNWLHCRRSCDTP
jgi:hypothetical protein